MSVASNLTDRIRVLKTLFTKRFIWPDLSDMAQTRVHAHQLVRDISANTNPLKFVDRLQKAANGLDFAGILGSAKKFERSDVPPWNSESSVSEFLGDLVFRLKARTVVELGCFVGWTSAHIALGVREANCNGKLWCVDTETRFLEIARENLARVGLGEQVEFLCGQSMDSAVLAKLPAEIDIVFIDTSHLYEDTCKELDIYSKRLSADGCIILHDTISWPGVRRAVGNIWDRFQSLTFATEGSNGVTVLRSKK